MSCICNNSYLNLGRIDNLVNEVLEYFPDTKYDYGKMFEYPDTPGVQIFMHEINRNCTDFFRKTETLFKMYGHLVEVDYPLKKDKKRESLFVVKKKRSYDSGSDIEEDRHRSSSSYKGKQPMYRKSEHPSGSNKKKEKWYGSKSR